MLLGYSLMTLARPIFAISHNFTLVFSARILDRLGNGIQATPRDALVGDLAPESRKGACFGLRQALGTAGSFFGGIVGIASMLLTSNNFQMVFLIASVPAILAVALLMILVKDPQQIEASGNSENIVKTKRQKLKWEDISKLGSGFWILMTVVSVFMLARLSEAFLILHANTNFDLPNEYAPVVLILYNATYSMSSYPIGKLSDRLGRPILLAIGIGILAITDLLLSFAPNLYVALAGIAIWGIQMGISQSMFLALIADHVPENLRGTGFGMFYVISGVSLFFASVGAGKIAETWNESAAYFASFVIASLSLIILLCVRKKLIVVKK
jgi:MFS family permease